eukprot:TRINITY_DN9808_c0_g1_i1.p1 TRINITY_DN9808_c0_g1~~TRINITY_DN9808_c0_g1_i1.p1  ORF type:complete len:191 (-),score=10.13 TRINITY_DN9808_c0_g1_i1:81-653(-)
MINTSQGISEKKKTLPPISVPSRRRIVPGTESQPHIQLPVASGSPLPLRLGEVRIGSATPKARESGTLSYGTSETYSTVSADVSPSRARKKKPSKFRNKITPTPIEEAKTDSPSKTRKKSILKLRAKAGEEWNSDDGPPRKDVNGTPIVKGSKRHRITFQVQPRVFPIENWKMYNRQNETDEHSCRCTIF